MSLVVIADPKLPQPLRRQIEAIRQQHDPNFKRVPAHFTLVFPSRTVDEAALTAHVRIVVEKTARIRFCLRTALLVKDLLTEVFHVYLVPEEGFSALVRLHDQLYTGPLSGSLRLELPFIPHITVGAFRDGVSGKKLADELNSQGLEMAGELDTISVFRFDDGALTLLDEINL